MEEFINVTLDPYFAGFIELFPYLIRLMLVLSTSLGIFLLYASLLALNEENPQITPQMASRNMMYKAFSGMMLITISYQLFFFDGSFFPESTNASMATALDQELHNKVLGISNGSATGLFFNPIAAAAFVGALIVVGLGAFIRGFYLISCKGNNGSLVQRETSFNQIFWHIVGGYALMQFARVAIT